MSSAAEPVHVDGPEAFESAINTHDVVLVDFYADWCGPCKMLAPTLEEIAEETTATIVKVDVDANQQLAAEHGVRSIPTLKLYAGGELVEEMVGVQEKERLVELIENQG